MPDILAKVLSLLADVLGIAMFSGILFFLVRRIKSRDLRPPKRSVFPLIVLLAILLTGFFAEGARLSIIHPHFAWSSPAGWLFSIFSPNSPVFMQAMIRLHFYIVLFFIAALPFTFMRLLGAATLNVYYRKKDPCGKLRPISLQRGPLGVNRVQDFSWKQLLDSKACVSCGRCEENCPAFISGKPLSPRK